MVRQRPLVKAASVQPVPMRLPRRDAACRRETYHHASLLLPEIEMIGWSHFDQPAMGQLPPHEHRDTWEICYLVSGRVDWWVGQQVYEITRGDIFITQPDEMHGGQDAMMHPCELYWLQFALPSTAMPGLSTTQARRLRRDYLALGLRQFPGQDILPDLMEQMLGVHRCPQAAAAHAVMRCRAAFQMLLLKVLELGQQRMHDLASRRTRRTSRIERAAGWIDAHLDEPFDIPQLARMAGLGPSQFRARFLEEVGQSPMEYAITRRIARAKQTLVTQPTMPITRIAHQLGYASSQYFATVFKHHTGLTPRQYRDRHQQQPAQARRHGVS